VPKKPRYELVREGDELVLLQDGKELARGLDTILDVVGRCPKCGARASSAYVTSSGYVYAWHMADDSTKHAWCMGPAAQGWGMIAEALRRKVVELSEEDRRVLHTVYVKKVKCSPEERKRARELLELILRARRVVIYG